MYVYISPHVPLEEAPRPADIFELFSDEMVCCYVYFKYQSTFCHHLIGDTHHPNQLVI